MNPNYIKSKTDPRKYLIAIIFVIILLMSNIAGIKSIFLDTFDSAFNPFLISIREFGTSTNIFFKEFTQRSSIKVENIELKRQLLKYDEALQENKDLKDQIARLENQTKIEAFNDRELKLVRVSGIQNLYSINPIVAVEYHGSAENIKGAPVFYEKNTLFGFVKNVSGKTAYVMPFYSPDISFSIPVQSVRDPSQKGFINKIDNGIVTIRNIPSSAAIQKGDAWVTTNDVADVPAGVIIGSVGTIREDKTTGFKEVELKLPFNLTETNYLFMDIK
jgi:cell shape-determining protein MreC